MLNRKQLALLHIAKDRLGLDDDTYRDVLWNVARAESARELDYIGFRRIMDHFNGLGFQSDWRRRAFGDRPGMATPAQIDTIRKMWQQFSGDTDEGRLNKWLLRTCKVSALRFLTTEGAHKAINGLRAMIARKKTDELAS
jgi:hypothetical protein